RKAGEGFRVSRPPATAAGWHRPAGLAAVAHTHRPGPRRRAGSVRRRPSPYTRPPQPRGGQAYDSHRPGPAVRRLRMSRLIRMDHTGHTTLAEWTADDPQAGDAAVR